MHTCDSVGLGNNGGAEGAHGMAETHSRVGNGSISFKIHNPPLTCSSEDSPASVPPASASHDCDDLVLQGECATLCAECYEAKSSATALTTQICHFNGYTYADAGCQFSICVTATLWQCSDSTVAQDMVKQTGGQLDLPVSVFFLRWSHMLLTQCDFCPVL